MASDHLNADEMQPVPIQSRHLMRLLLTDELVFHILISMNQGTFMLPVFPELPPDATIRGIAHEFDSACWSIYFEHPSFPEVFSGDVIPRMAPVPTAFRVLAQTDPIVVVGVQ